MSEMWDEETGARAFDGDPESARWTPHDVGGGEPATTPLPVKSATPADSPRGHVCRFCAGTGMEL